MIRFSAVRMTARDYGAGSVVVLFDGQSVVAVLGDEEPLPETAQHSASWVPVNLVRGWVVNPYTPVPITYDYYWRLVHGKETYYSYRSADYAKATRRYDLAMTGL